ncbi:hypothetical protein [Tellurirhabdus bombi]|uniref:hypothetical protein n=1 Tax=Tellurirhabdus bombi TaxID=2907205 RepID=UPI001F186A09|nr:hypothetical protein [Tellurirhabdus bombi]
MKLFTSLRDASKKVALMAVGLGLLASCAPRVYQVKPVSGDVAWIEGRPVTKDEKSGITVVASYERLDMQYVALDIEIKNNTDRALEINPADFQYAALDKAKDTLRNQYNGYVVYAAADPTKEADRVAANQIREEKRIKRAKVINTVLMVAAIASDVASSSSGQTRKSAERWVNNRVTHNNIYTAIQAKRMIDHGTFADRMERYDYERYRWKELALKRTTVPAGESARGLVYLPLKKEAAYLQVSYPVLESDPVEVVFQQDWVKRERKRRQ